MAAPNKEEHGEIPSCLFFSFFFFFFKVSFFFRFVMT